MALNLLIRISIFLIVFSKIYFSLIKDIDNQDFFLIKEKNLRNGFMVISLKIINAFSCCTV